MESIKKFNKVLVLGVKSPERSSLSATRGDEVPFWADRMELKIETLMQLGDKIHSVKVCEDTELLLQKDFTPLKNPDCRALQRQFLVPHFPVTMAPKPDKVIATECLPAVRSTD